MDELETLIEIIQLSESITEDKRSELISKLRMLTVRYNVD